ncbi:MAG: hypothetical protein V4618_03765 [Pseudomonadota bacterium]
MHILPTRRLRHAAAAMLLATTGLSAAGTAAEPAPFDLSGPALKISVTRGGVTLPIAQVPSFAEGDKLIVRADFPEDQRARFLLVSTFLQGATNPPPKAWIQTADPWKKKDKDKQLELVVPKGARQLVLFLVPASGGAASAISDAARGRPGEFVRATQDLNQASLDRARLDGFMAAIRAQENSHPEYLRSVAPTLARSLAMKLNEDCLSKVIELQASCLLENRDTLVLADVHSSSMSEAIAGAPTDLALQLSQTREAGLGYYSPYIGVIRDIARVFGAFSNPQLGYLPSLSLRRGDSVSLLLNAAPSFDKPRSVLVAAMPAIEANSPPRLRATAGHPLCGAKSGLVLPVDGAPLIYATDYLRGMTLRLTAGDRTVDLPVEARADRGGYVLTGAMPTDLKGRVPARLHGYWGFDAYEGPEFALQFPSEGAWTAVGEASSLVTGRDNGLDIAGPSPACVTSVTMRRGSEKPQSIASTLSPDGNLALTLPMKDSRPGDMTIEIRQMATAAPSALTLRAYRQASRLDRLVVHSGDRAGTLSGQRLDQVARVDLAGLKLAPAGLSRDGDTDKLRVSAEGEGDPIAADASGSSTARVTLLDGRALDVPVTFAASRPRVALIERTRVPKGVSTSLAMEIADNTVLPDNSRLIFSIRAGEGTHLASGDAVEITTADDEGAKARLSPGPDLRLQGPNVLIATLDPATLGPSVFGPLRFRLVRESEASDWYPLATLARLPRISGISCGSAGSSGCTLRGDGLFLIERIGAGAKVVQVPEGFTGTTFRVPTPVSGKLTLRLRDAPDQPVTLAVKPNAG